MKGVMRNNVAKATPRMNVNFILQGIEEPLKGFSRAST